MADNDRFYMLQFKGDTPAYFGDIGSYLNLSGMLLQGQGLSVLLVAPTGEKIETDASLFRVIYPSLEEWCEIIKISDDPRLLELDKDGNIKAIHRKQRYAISGAVQQKIWARDHFKCLYCGKPMGNIQLTIDHFVPIEQGGEDNETNYASACRNCNKKKGKMSAVDFLGFERSDIVKRYLKNHISFDTLSDNLKYLKTWILPHL